MTSYRLSYVDALRGLAIIFIVFGHVETFSFFEFRNSTVLGRFLAAIQIPLFFFISGFVSYKPQPMKSISVCIKSIKTKFYQLIIPAIIVGLIYTYVKVESDFIGFISNSPKLGYWFTISYFEMLLLYYVLSLLINTRYKKDGIIALVGVSLLCYILEIPLQFFPVLDTIANYTSLHFTFINFQFFILGLIVRKYSHIVQRYFSDQKIVSLNIFLLIILFFVLELSPKLINIDSINGKCLIVITKTLIAYPTIFILFMIFRKHYNSKFLGGALEFVGRRTLDIYLLHYFVLPCLPMIGTFLLTYPNIIVECIIGFTLALCIIIFSIGIGTLIRFSPILSKFILGAK